jgi:hypothetical protein
MMQLNQTKLKVQSHHVNKINLTEHIHLAIKKIEISDKGKKEEKKQSSKKGPVKGK